MIQLTITCVSKRQSLLDLRTDGTIQCINKVSLTSQSKSVRL